MTRVQPGQPDSQQDDNKARAFFATALLIGGGFAGLAVAGIVLGFDYMLHGEPHERERLAQQRAQRNRDRFADALAWLENDRAERERHRKAAREWFTADPATRGDKPSSGETAGKALGRAWNTLLVGAGRFKRGWQKGRADARQRRDNGDSAWWKQPQRDKPDPAAEPPTPDPLAERLMSPENQDMVGGGTEPAPQQPSNDPDIVDAEIVTDPEPSTHVMVPVGQDEQRRPDESLDEYQRRLDDLAGEVQQNRNGHRPDPPQTVLR